MNWDGWVILAIIGIGIVAIFWNPPAKHKWEEENGWGDDGHGH